MSFRDQYPLLPEFRRMSDENILLILLVASDEAKKIGHPFELHPGEKALANEYLLIGSKLDGFCARFKLTREQALEAIDQLLEWPCPPNS
jgi:hypothetical protein